MFFSAYFTKLRCIWDEIQSFTSQSKCICGKCSCNLGRRLVEDKEREHIYEFLMSLNEEFQTVRTQILSIKPMLTLRAFYHLVDEDEEQRSITMSCKTVVEAVTYLSRS